MNQTPRALDLVASGIILALAGWIQPALGGCCAELPGNCQWVDIFNELHATNCPGPNAVCCTGSRSTFDEPIYVCCSTGHCLFWSDSSGQLYATCDGAQPWTGG